MQAVKSTAELHGKKTGVCNGNTTSYSNTTDNTTTKTTTMMTATTTDLLQSHDHN